MKRQWSSISAVSLALAQSRKIGQIPQHTNRTSGKPEKFPNRNFADLVHRAWSQHNPQQALGSQAHSEHVRMNFDQCYIGMLWQRTLNK